ncbi:hypothetical protein BaRGS_00031120, partial [Batillaria attramentaria]
NETGETLLRHASGAALGAVLADDPWRTPPNSSADEAEIQASSRTDPLDRFLHNDDDRRHTNRQA